MGILFNYFQEIYQEFKTFTENYKLLSKEVFNLLDDYHYRRPLHKEVISSEVPYIQEISFKNRNLTVRPKNSQEIEVPLERAPRKRKLKQIILDSQPTNQ